MSIAQNIVKLAGSLPPQVTLVAVSKFHPAEAIREAYDAGQRVFGESRAQELVGKWKALPTDIEWHFIGPLQSNKAKDIAPFVRMIHSVDSRKLLEEVNKQAERNNRHIDILLEIHVAQEESKHGFSPEECEALLCDEAIRILPNIRLRGLMTMATFTDNEAQIRAEFHIVSELFARLKRTILADDADFNVLSMGMSHDYPIAIEEGSTMIRVGTHIFGEREY